MRRLCVLLAAVAAAVGTGSSLAASGGPQAGAWLTLAQAKVNVKAKPVPLAYCENASTGDGYCLGDWRAVQLRVLSATVRGYGPSRVRSGKRRWRAFLVNVTCGSDRLSGLQYRGRFVWEWNASRLAPETWDPQNPDMTGVAQLGC